MSAGESMPGALGPRNESATYSLGRLAGRGKEMNNLTGRPVVLIVEDESLIRIDAIEMIEAAGFDTLEAANADEAIAILSARPDIHVVFTDIQMPGSMDGVKLAHFV